MFGQAFPVTINYSQSVEQMIVAGKYDYVDESITATNFPVTGKKWTVSLEIVLFHLNRGIESEDVVKEMKQMGLRPATLPELCAYGAKYPDLQWECPIVCLGSSWVDPGGYRGVPCLEGGSRGRSLDLLYWGMEWPAGYRFAAVRKHGWLARFRFAAVPASA